MPKPAEREPLTDDDMQALIDIANGYTGSFTARDAEEEAKKNSGRARELF
jgi:hypothetical protein